MKHQFILWLVLVLSGHLFAGETATNNLSPAHQFEYVTYPWIMPAGKMSYRVMVPSSIYKYGHGHAMN